MLDTSPLARYQHALTDGTYQPDDAQHQAVKDLDAIYQAVLQQKAEAPSRKPASSGLLGWLHKKVINSDKPQDATVKGLYMWGGVGRGKTWLMDLFYQSLPGERKLRLHFHRFMLRVHAELTAQQGHENPLEMIADGFKAEADILCFDEFFVSDITDAMLLGTLFEALFKRGIILVATSNIPPDNLYHNGLQRARFLPAIELIKSNCKVLNVDAGIDYRLRTLTQANLFITPLGAETAHSMGQTFRQLVGGEGHGSKTLEINHRPLNVLDEADGVLAVAFSVLCQEARSQMDYIALSRLYHTVLLHNLTQMNSLQEDIARRFLALVDEFYERRVKLIISADVDMYQIYSGDRLKFEYQRCLSRLQEMQSEEYLSLEHLP